VAEIRAFLFDLDGTLVDTRESNYLAYRDAFLDAGYDLTREVFATTWGKDSREFIVDLLPRATPADVLRIRNRKAEVYEAHLPQSRLNTGLVELVRHARDHVRTALVTTAKRLNVEQTLRTHGIAHLFEVIVNGDDVIRPKPHPEAYLLALQTLRLDASQGLAFEDSGPGVAAAAAAGLDVVKVDFDA